MTPSLISRLEAAEAGTKDLGIEVLLHFGWHRTHVGHFCGPLYQWSAPDRKPCLIQGDEDRLPNPATSLDAALALAERVLGGEIAMNLLADVLDVDEARLLSVSDLPRLLCAAILRAKGSDQ